VFARWMLFGLPDGEGEREGEGEGERERERERCDDIKIPVGSPGAVDRKFAYIVVAARNRYTLDALSSPRWTP
jgi:hypothetical protein